MGAALSGGRLQVVVGQRQSFNFVEEIFYLNLCITERTFQCVAVNFIMERKNNHSPISVLHLYMAAFPMHFDKT